MRNSTNLSSQSWTLVGLDLPAPEVRVHLPTQSSWVGPLSTLDPVPDVVLVAGSALSVCMSLCVSISVFLSLSQCVCFSVCCVYSLSQYESFSYVCLSQCVCVFVSLSVHG